MSTNKLSNTNTTKDFNRLVYMAVLILGVLLLVLVALNLLSGPRLRNVSLDRAKVTSQTGQRIILHANQPLAKVEPSSVRIEPAAAFSVANSADTITINLKQRLQYNTAYMLSVKGVAAASRSKHTTDFTYYFTTADPTLYYLKRVARFDNAGTASDYIMQTTLHGTDTTTVFSAPKIIDYTLVGNHLVVSSSTGDGRGKLSAVDLATKKVAEIELPDNGIATQLRSSSDGTSFGFAYSSPEAQATQSSDSYHNTLFISDIRPGHNVVPLLGIGSKPIRVFDWRFAPDGTSVVARLSDQSLLLIDGNFKHPPVPLGTFSSISNFSADGTKLLVSNRDGFSMLNLIRHNLNPIPDGQIGSDLEALLEVSVLPADSGYLRHYQTTSTDRTTFSDYLRYDHASTKKVIYDTARQRTDIQALELSPNGQLAILEASPDGSVDYDDYPYASRPLSARTQMVDMATGTIVKELNGIKAIVE